MEHPVLASAFATIRRRCVQRWEEAEIDEVGVQHAAKMELHALEALERQLRILVDNGSVAESILRAREVRET